MNDADTPDATFCVLDALDLIRVGRTDDALAALKRYSIDTPFPGDTAWVFLVLMANFVEGLVCRVGPDAFAAAVEAARGNVLWAVGLSGADDE